MHLSREIAGGLGEILELRIGGEKCYRPQTNEDAQRSPYLCGRGENIQNQLEPTLFFPLGESLQAKCCTRCLTERRETVCDFLRGLEKRPLYRKLP